MKKQSFILKDNIVLHEVVGKYDHPECVEFLKKIEDFKEEEEEEEKENDEFVDSVFSS